MDSTPRAVNTGCHSHLFTEGVVNHYPHHLEDNFTRIPNDFIRDSRLSPKARHLQVFMFSFPPHFTFTQAFVAKENKVGLSSVQSAFRELQKYGYLIYRIEMIKGRPVKRCDLYLEPQI